MHRTYRTIGPLSDTARLLFHDFVGFFSENPKKRETGGREAESPIGTMHC